MICWPNHLLGSPRPRITVSVSKQWKHQVWICKMTGWERRSSDRNLQALVNSEPSRFSQTPPPYGRGGLRSWRNGPATRTVGRHISGTHKLQGTEQTESGHCHGHRRVEQRRCS